MRARVRSAQSLVDRPGSHRRLHLGALTLFGGVVAAGVLSVVADAAPPPSFAATAEIAAADYYVGDAAGSVYAFTVTNTGTSTSIGAIEVQRPGNAWTLTACPTKPAGWSAQLADTKCRFRSAAGTQDDIRPGESRTFEVRATTLPGTTNRPGTWRVVVSRSNHFDTKSLLRNASPAEEGALTTTLYVFEITDAVVTNASPAAGAACPAPNKEAVTGSTRDVVVCGRNRATVALTPAAAFSALGGTFLASPGTFSSGSIPAGSGHVVLARWTGAQVTSTFGLGNKTVTAKVGSATGRTSPLPYVTLTGYSATNQPPVATAESYGTDEDTALVVGAPGVLGNDSDPEGAALTAALDTGAPHGTLTLDTDGSFTYLPDADWNGTDSFSYAAYDGIVYSSPVTVTITVGAVPDPPVAHDDAADTAETSTVVVPVLANDVDPDGDTLTVDAVSFVGTVGTVSTDGTTVTYDPNGMFAWLAAGQTAVDSFTYKVTDGAGSSTATVQVTVQGKNDPPVANDDSYASDEDSLLVVSSPGVLGNDTDLDGPSLAAMVTTEPAHGSVSLAADGSYTYVPDANFHGSDSFAYAADDGAGGVDEGTVSITVRPVNDPPVAFDTDDGTDEDVTTAVLLPAYDVDHDDLTFAIADSPDHGTLGTITGDSVTYTPDADWNGTDYFSFTVTDGVVTSAAGWVTVVVQPVNDPPVAVDDEYSTVGSEQLTVVALVGVLANDTDVDGDTLGATVTTGPEHGTLGFGSSGSFTYTSDAGFTGDDTFTYAASDGSASDTATVTIHVIPPNVPPVATDVTPADLLEDSAAVTVTLAATDGNGDSLTYAVGTGPAHGSLGTVTGNTVTYTPAADFWGTDSFTFTAHDGTVGSNVATAHLTVQWVNDPPTFTGGPDQTVAEDAGPRTVPSWATAISAGPGDESAQLTGFVTTNDAPVLFAAQPAVSPAGTLTYTPAANAHGSANVSVVLYDEGGTANGGVDHSALHTFTITVTPVNDVPVAGDDSLSTDEDTYYDVTVVANDTDVDGDPLAVSSLDTTGTVGAVTDNGGGVVRYDPAGRFDDLQTGDVATDSFSYTVGDGHGGTSTAVVTVVVTGVNDVPVVTGKAHAAIGNTLVTVGTTSSAPHLVGDLGGTLLTGVTDPDDGTWTAGADATSAHGGTVTANADGTFSYLPPQGYQGSDTFTFTATDPHGATSASGTVTVSVANMVWYVDNSASPGGTGRSTEPFDGLAPLRAGGSADSLDGSGDVIFLYQGSGDYAGGLALEAGQRLYGQPHGLTVAGTSLVSAGSANPVIIGGLVVADGTDTQGVSVGSTAGFALSGWSVGSATVGTTHPVAVANPAGGGISLNGGAPTVELSSLSSSAGANGIDLVNLGGSVTIGGGSLTGSTGSVVSVSGGTGSLTYGGTVVAGTGTHSVAVLGKTGGTVTLSGNVVDSGTGITLWNNTGATIGFGGILTLSTGAYPAFSATGGGTVTATNPASTVETANGTGIVVTATNIGAAGLTFRSVTVNGSGGWAPANGIALSQTGTAGGLRVLGTGGPATGGTIRGTTGIGISLDATKDVQLGNVLVRETGNHGIKGTGVNGLTLTGVQVIGAGDADNERAVDLVDASGTVAISNGIYDDASDDLVRVQQSSTDLTLTVTGVTFSNLVQSTANNAIDLQPNGTTALTASVTGSTFANLKNSSVFLGASAAGSTGTSTLTFDGNTVSGGTQGGAGVLVSGQESTTTTVTITGSSFTGAGGIGVVTYDVNDDALVKATLSANTFTAPLGHAVVAAVDETGDIRLLATGNQITNAGGDGFQLTNFGDASATNLASTASYVVTGNTINGHSLTSGTRFVGAIGIFNFENDGDTTIAAVSGNTVTGTQAGFFDIYLQDMAATPGALVFEESPDTAATGAVSSAYLKAENPGTTQANDVNVGAQYSNGATCPLP